MTVEFYVALVTCGAHSVEKLMVSGRWLVEYGKHITHLNQQVMQQHQTLAKKLQAYT